jgi:hypothetical protein
VVHARGGAVTWCDRCRCVGTGPEASAFAKKVARGYAAEVDLYEKALIKRNGNQLPKELEAKLARISKMAASRKATP